MVSTRGSLRVTDVKGAQSRGGGGGRGSVDSAEGVGS